MKKDGRLFDRSQELGRGFSITPIHQGCPIATFAGAQGGPVSQTPTIYAKISSTRELLSGAELFGQNDLLLRILAPFRLFTLNHHHTASFFIPSSSKTRSLPRSLEPRPSTYTAPCPRILLKCFKTASFASKNLSTQFCVHDSSFRSNLPDEILPVTHFVQQMSVRL